MILRLPQLGHRFGSAGPFIWVKQSRQRAMEGTDVVMFLLYSLVPDAAIAQ